MKNLISSLSNRIKINKILSTMSVETVHDMAKTEMDRLIAIMKEFRGQENRSDDYCLKVQKDIKAINGVLDNSLKALNIWKNIYTSFDESGGHLGVAVFTRMIVLQNAVFYLQDFEMRELNLCPEFMWEQKFSSFIVDFYARLDHGNCNLKINVRDDKALDEWRYQQKVCSETTVLFNEKRVGMFYDSFIRGVASRLFMPESPIFYGAFSGESGSMEWPPRSAVYKLRKGSYATAEQYKNFGVTVSGPEKLSIPEEVLEHLRLALNDCYTEQPFLVITTGVEQPSTSENDERMKSVVQYVEFLKDNGILFAEFGNRRPESDPLKQAFFGKEPFTTVEMPEETKE